MQPWSTCAIAALVSAGACLPGAGPPLNPYADDAGKPPPVSLGDDASTLMDVDLGAAFAVSGLQPAHGPWSGGTRTNISGRGFSSNVQVWIGGGQPAGRAELPKPAGAQTQFAITSAATLPD